MRVLHVLNELRPSGAEMMLKIAGPVWGREGISAEILATGANVGPYIDELVRSGYRVHHLPSERTIGYFFKYLKFLIENNYHLVHQHVEGMGFWFSLFSLFSRAGVVRTVHNNFLFDGWVKWRRAIQRRILSRLGVMFVSISPGVQNNEKSRFGIDTELVLNWVDVNRYAPLTNEERSAARSKMGLDDNVFVVATVGNCSDVKNHAALIDAISVVGANRRLHYLHLGVEDSEMSERKRAVDVGVAQSVSFLGWVPNSREFLAAADIFVMPSIFEGLGLAAVEALALELPCILSDCDGLRDLAPNFPKAIYCQPDANSLAEALLRVTESNDALQSAANVNANAIVAKLYGVERGVREYAELYRRVSNRSKSHD